MGKRAFAIELNRDGRFAYPGTKGFNVDCDLFAFASKRERDAFVAAGTVRGVDEDGNRQAVDNESSLRILDKVDDALRQIEEVPEDLLSEVF